MASYLLGWNPKNPHYNFTWENLPQMAAKVRRGEEVWDGWSLPKGVKKFKFGDRLYILKQGPDERGIVGSAHVKGTKGKRSIRFTYDALLDPATEKILATDDLRKKVPNVYWSPQGSGNSLGLAADAVESVWRAHLKRVGGKFKGLSDCVVSPEEVGGADALDRLSELLPAGSVRRVTIDAYERNPEAREKCIRHHKAICAACKLNFADRYGKLGAGFIHVHHTKPIAKAGIGYKLNPIRDLVPVCPNCHAMLHRNPGRVLKVAQLQRILQDQRRRGTQFRRKAASSRN